MFELIGLDGSPIFVTPNSIARIKYIDFQDPGVGTKVDYGRSALFTNELAEDLLFRLQGISVFIQLTVRADAPVWLNVALIAEIRAALPINGPGTEILVGGRYQHVIEQVDEVHERIMLAQGG